MWTGVAVKELAAYARWDTSREKRMNNYDSHRHRWTWGCWAETSHRQKDKSRTGSLTRGISDDGKTKTDSHREPSGGLGGWEEAGGGGAGGSSRTWPLGVGHSRGCGVQAGGAVGSAMPTAWSLVRPPGTAPHPDTNTDCQLRWKKCF